MTRCPNCGTGMVERPLGPEGKRIPDGSGRWVRTYWQCQFGCGFHYLEPAELILYRTTA